MKNKHTFGPINSRRFGLSLGVDLSSATKQCNFDCLYCELEGKKATKIQVNVAPVNEILDEVQEAFGKYSNIDVLTLTANGEPTMYPYLRELITGVNKIKQKFNTHTKILILSNATSMMDEGLRNILLDIDIVKLSLDSVDAKIFKKIDRPHRDISIKGIIKGILEFKKIYSNELVIEILFVKNLNDKKSHIKKLNKTLKQIKPYRVDISSIDRPPAYNVSAISNKKLFKIKNRFSKKLNISVAYNKKTNIKTMDFTKNEILNMLKRRPQNKQDVDTLFSKSSRVVFDGLVDAGEIIEKNTNQDTFFVLHSLR